MRHRAWRRFFGAESPAAIAAVGALFALSFDTLSLAAQFAFATERFGGVVHTIGAAALFVLAMACVDGANGIWISRLVRRADRSAAIASRVLSAGVIATSLIVGFLVAARLATPLVDAGAKGRSRLLGIAVYGGVLLAFFPGLLAARHAGVDASRAAHDAYR